jgi:autoinducer 2 (AI-2) kinase
MNAYLIIDIGTGNVRVALVSVDGRLIWVERDNVIYKKDGQYKEALFFDPDFLWKQIVKLINKGLTENKEVQIVAVTASSQREGIVLLDKAGKSMIGFPNHDHRGRFIEDSIKDKDAVYRLTGRYPTSLFSALKLAAYREKYPEEWKQMGCFLSISDWAQFMLTGVKGYEHAQASETLLYDVENKCWSDELLALFDIDKNVVPPLYFSGTKLGGIKEEFAAQWNLNTDTPVYVGGADTQLAVKSTRPEVGDVVIVSGTTTPVVNITTHYVLDDLQRSWTNSHLDQGQYILETNCGVTGLNYQRVKAIFYPDDSYGTIEAELDQMKDPSCFAHLGSLLADDKEIVTRGGFLFEVPVMTELSRADFALAALWDIACSIKENLNCLLEIQYNANDYVWCCGGGFQSRHLREYVAGLTGKKLLFRPGYQQASVSGAAVVCSEASGNHENMDTTVEVVQPGNDKSYTLWYEKWRETREGLKKMAKSQNTEDV